MPFLLPTRVATALLGLILGYSVGFLFEIKSSSGRNYQSKVERLLTNIYWNYCCYRYQQLQSDDSQEEDYLDLVKEAFDNMHTDTSDEDTEYSE